MSVNEYIVLLAVPFFLLLIAIEMVMEGKKYWRQNKAKDLRVSIVIGIGFFVIAGVTKGLLILCYVSLNKYSLFMFPQHKWWMWLLCFIADDFTYYWFHRISHRVRFFWATHIVHHSSEIYSYGAALRQGWTGNITGTFLMWAWMPLLGFDASMVLMIKSLSIIYQFWTHTELIKKTPVWIEAIFNTPSHHRVHHGRDAAYIDKNYGGVLIIWDRLFKSFKAEEASPKYGTVKKIDSHNPFVIPFFEWRGLLKDIKKVAGLHTLICYLFKPPGWQQKKQKEV